MRSIRVSKGVQGAALAAYTAGILVATLLLSSGRAARTNLAPFEDLGRLAVQARRGDLLSEPFLLGVAGIAGNLLLFAPWAFLAWKFLDGADRSTLRTHVDVLLFGVLLSVGVEAVQLFLPTRAADVNDVLWNVLGTVVGALLAHVGRDLRLDWE